MAEPMIFSVNGTSFYELGATDMSANTCFPDGRYYSSDASSGFGPPPLISSLEFDTRNIEWPGLNGIGTKTYGERGIMITAALVYIYAAKADILSALTTDFCITFSQIARYTIIMPDAITTFTGCKLVRGGAATGSWGPPLNAKSVAVVNAVWRDFNVNSYGPNGGS